jgi:hypothetical protein
MTAASHFCLLCGTRYYALGICDWDDVELTPIKFPESALDRADLENHHLKTSGEFERRRDHAALVLQANLPKGF